jgi:hypothetical protein
VDPLPREVCLDPRFLYNFTAPRFGVELPKLQSDTRRYHFTTPPNVVDLGLRLADVQALQLQSKPVWYDSHVDPRQNLRQCGATDAESPGHLASDSQMGVWVAMIPSGAMPTSRCSAQAGGPEG